MPIPSIGIFTSAAKSLRAVFVAAVTLGLLTHVASAQQTLGSINGTVMDAIPFLNPGESGVPPCGLSVTKPPQTPETVCDTLETGYGPTGRNAFRAPFQTRFDFSIVKNFKVSERMALKFEADAFNIINHPSFDAPNGNFTLNPCFSPNPCYLTPGTILTSGNTNNFGVIQQTVGSNRFLQLAAHLTFSA